MSEPASDNLKGWYITFVVMIINLLVLMSVFSVGANELQAQGATTSDATILIDDMPAAPTGDTAESFAEKGYVVERISVGEVPAGDFVVGPGKIELEVAPGTSKTVMMMVTNRMGKAQDFFFSVEDTRAGQDPSVTIELMGAEQGPYSLRDYISFPNSKITLEHGERARFPVTVAIPANADPGGLYGSVLVKTVAVERRDATETNLVPQSPIEARIGTLFFVTVSGETHREGKTLDFSTVPDKAWFEQGPITFNILFENTGSIHLAPYGRLSITNILGDEVGFLELDPWFAMPQSQRFREVIWNNSNLLGRYTATLELNRGYDDIIDTKTVTFWVLPWKIVLGATLGLFLILFLIRTFFKNFEFKRKV